jgi:competence protein ComEC
MIVGGLALLSGLVFRPLGQVVGSVAWVFLAYTIEMVRLTARVPFASVSVHMGSWMVWAYYALLAGLTWWFKQARERRAELWHKFTSNVQAKFILGAPAVLLILAFFFWRGLPDGKLHVTFLDVGQGDAILIQTPSGKQILIDGGPSETQVLAQLGRQMPFWDRTLDVVVLTHPDSDHINGLVPVLERYQVDVVIHRQIEMDSETYDYWLELVADEGASVYEGQAGLSLTLDEGLEMLILHPGVEVWESANDNSVVTRLVYGQVSFLLTGDIEAEVEEALVGAGAIRESTLLKAAHHGSCSSTTQAFLDAVDPELVVISVGADNTFGHPCDEVLDRLEGLPVYRTDEHGIVEVVSDGTQVRVEVQRDD